MKITEILLHTANINMGETQKNVKSAKGIKYLLFFLILSCISFLPSCAVELRSPQPDVSIESHNHGSRHQRNHRHSRDEHRDNDDRHNKDDRH